MSNNLKIRNIENLKTNGAYIFCMGTLGEKVRDLLNKYNIPFKGFIDNKNSNALKLYQVSDSQANILVCTINYMYEIAEQCKNSGYENIFVFTDLLLMFSELKHFNICYDGLYQHYQRNKAKYDKLYDIFEDEKSKYVLDKIIEYRKTFDYTIFSKINSGIENQYFNSLLPIENNSVLVDGGAYDGDTAAKFIKFFHNYKKIYCFEPDDNNFEKLQKNTQNYYGVECYKMGLSDCSKDVYFSGDSSTGAKIVESSSYKIKVAAMDDIVEEDKAIIKLDIEGAERFALKGAERLIKNNSVLVLSVYHRPDDLYELPKIIKNINPNYLFYLRHYTNCIFETVLYAIPKK